MRCHLHDAYNFFFNQLVHILYDTLGTKLGMFDLYVLV